MKTLLPAQYLEKISNFAAPKDKQKLLKAVSLIEEKSLAMLKENPFLRPLQAAILVALNIESELLDYKESKNLFLMKLQKIIDSIREELKDNIDE